MLQQLKEALVDKLDEQRESQTYCLVRWTDNKQKDIIPQKLIISYPSDSVRVHSTYFVDLDGHRRQATILAKGTRRECEDTWDRLSPSSGPKSPIDAAGKNSTLLSDVIIIRIMNTLADRAKRRAPEETDEDVHHVQCAACGVKPLIQTDRYRCLECSTSSSGYDLCGRCFERRRQSDQHQSSHAMVHFKLPNEFLGIELNGLHSELNLDKIKTFHTLQNEYHDGITCDGECGRKNFRGLRFKCDTCPNYNLCERCGIERRSISKHHQRDHPLVLASNRTMPKISPDDIEFGDTLGRGGFGYVCKAKWISKNRQVACKVIEVSGLSETAQQLKQSFLMELAAYRELSGPYIIRTFAYATQHRPASGPRRETEQFMILMEFMHRGSLQNMLEQQPNEISLRRKLTFARQVAAGMRRIHQHGMVHRDIRPDNILVTENYVAKIGDMGIVRVLDPSAQHTQIGCLHFMPPEFFAKSIDHRFKCDEKLDIYTYGLTLNQLFTETSHELDLSNPTNGLSLRKTSPVFYEEIILPSINRDPKRRPTAEFIENTLEMYEHAFSETMQSEAYVRMNANERNREFARFYETNRRNIQRLLHEKLASPSGIEVPIHVAPSKKYPVEQVETPSSEPCRIN